MMGMRLESKTFTSEYHLESVLSTTILVNLIFSIRIDG